MVSCQANVANLTTYNLHSSWKTIGSRTQQSARKSTWINDHFVNFFCRTKVLYKIGYWQSIFEKANSIIAKYIAKNTFIHDFRDEQNVFLALEFKVRILSLRWNHLVSSDFAWLDPRKKTEKSRKNMRKFLKVLPWGRGCLWEQPMLSEPWIHQLSLLYGAAAQLFRVVQEMALFMKYTLLRTLWRL